MKGRDVIDLGMGNPDNSTPKHIVDKLIETINLNNNVKDQEIKWEAQGLPSGVYFIRLVSDYDKQFKKVLYLK